jgi:hypothetical protein
LYDFDPAAEKKQADEAAKAKAFAKQGIAPPPAGAQPDSDTSSDDGSADDDSNDTAEDSRLIVVTDLGMLVKRALDGSQDVFVQSIRTGQPVAGADVSVLAVNGQTLFTETTGADGMVHFPTFKGLDREKQPSCMWSRKPTICPSCHRWQRQAARLLALRHRRRSQCRESRHVVRLPVLRSRHLSPWR